MISTAVVNYPVYNIYKLLSQTLDIQPRFILQFVVYCIVFTVSIHLFTAIPNKNHYYYHYYYYAGS